MNNPESVGFVPFVKSHTCMMQGPFPYPPQLFPPTAMFSLHSFFPTLPSAEATERRRQHLQRANAEGFCRKLVSQIVNSVDVPAGFEPTLFICQGSALTTRIILAPDIPVLKDHIQIEG